MRGKAKEAIQSTPITICDSSLPSKVNKVTQEYAMLGFLLDFDINEKFTLLSLKLGSM